MAKIEELAEIVEAAAQLMTVPRPGEIEHRSPISNAAFDIGVMNRWLESDRPAKWINEMTYTYVLESSHELTSIAILLRGGHVAGAVEPIVRALVERAGPDSSARRRRRGRGAGALRR